MSPTPPYPFDEFQIFNRMASLFGERSSSCPVVQIEGTASKTRSVAENYDNQWKNIIWPSFRKWWSSASPEDKLALANDALDRVIFDFDAIPSEIWKRVLLLSPADGDKPFIGEV